MVPPDSDLIFELELLTLVPGSQNLDDRGRPIKSKRQRLPLVGNTAKHICINEMIPLTLSVLLAFSFVRLVLTGFGMIGQGSLEADFY